MDKVYIIRDKETGSIYSVYSTKELAEKELSEIEKQRVEDKTISSNFYIYDALVTNKYDGNNFEELVNYLVNKYSIDNIFADCCLSNRGSSKGICFNIPHKPDCKDKEKCKEMAKSVSVKSNPDLHIKIRAINDAKNTIDILLNNDTFPCPKEFEVYRKKVIGEYLRHYINALSELRAELI